MTFTVLIPCHNDAQYLPRSVGSAAQQLSIDDEILVIDDGSDEPVAPVVAALAEGWPDLTIHCHHQHQAGVAAARNRGIDMARGDYLIMLDADDELLPGAVARYRDKMNNADWIISAHEWQVGDERTVRHPDVDAPQQELFRRYLDKRLHLGNLSCMCIRREHAKHIRFAEHLRVGEDLVFLCLLIANHPPSGDPHPNARVHRREHGSLRSASSLEDTQQSQVFTTLFEHEALPAAYAGLRTLAEARHCRSVMRMAWRHKRGDVYRQWHTALWHLEPTSALNPKFLARRLLLAVRR